jgi:hypothetical protein
MTTKFGETEIIYVHEDMVFDIKKWFTSIYLLIKYLPISFYS